MAKAKATRLGVPELLAACGYDGRQQFNLVFPPVTPHSILDVDW